MLAEQREDDPEALPPSNTEVSRRVSAQWAQMTEEEKEPYLEVAEREMERYQAAKKEEERKKRRLVGRDEEEEMEEEREEEEEEEEGRGSWERRKFVVPADQTAFLEGLDWEGSQQ